MRLYHTVFPLNSPGEVDMHGLVILILTTVVYHHYTVRASGECHPPELGPNTMPVTGTTPTDSRIRINCTKGFLRKAGTSNLFQCKPDQTGEAIWRNVPPLQCIRDPRSPMMTTTPDQHFMPLTSEKTFTPTNPDSTNSWKSWPTTGSITFSPTNEVATTKTRTTTNQPILRITTTANEIASSTSSASSTREYITTDSSLLDQSSTFTTTTGVSVSVKTSTHCTGNGTPLESPDHYKSTVGGVTGILLLCLAAAGFLLYWRLRHRETNYNGVPLNQINQTNCTSYFPVSVSVIEGCPAEENIADAVNL
ncbi:interleukin-15 receptor subunit alpha isoform X2 [Xyrauchen texanus]|uniref:interleukin-15 receptor subunit alpha isoform X2 n=1 Tax=Xyrauchen texanus TaxID=154827 RepID=UPI0022423FA8|nr:interleukin-15 receptor subunit alpha isoform X2 [Xyrauchen texanus]